MSPLHETDDEQESTEFSTPALRPIQGERRKLKPIGGQRVTSKTCMCGKTFWSLTKQHVWCSNRCRKRNSNPVLVSRRARRALTYNALGHHTQEEWGEKLKVSAYLCYWCGRELYERHVTKEHLIPLSRGGSENIDNIVPSCGRCNSRKGSKTADEFREYLRAHGELEGGIST